MSYDPITDFLGLLRDTGSGDELARMPGLDYSMAVLARAGLISLSVGQTAPTVNQATTVWLRPALPSWTAEGNVFLWDAAAAAYALATPSLWKTLLAPPDGYLFQSVVAGYGVVNAGTSLLAVQRTAPAVTVLTLPTVLNQWRTGRPLKIVDWSGTVVNHVAVLTPASGDTIMKLPSWQLLSTAAQLFGVTLHPSPDLNGWVIAP